MKLPQDFKERYEQLLGDESEAFLASFGDEPVAAFRVNPLKEKQVSFEEPIPNTPWGYYGKVSGHSSYHTTGLVYSQEPAAQMVAQVADVKQGMRVLDLAAAPGGKSTHLLSYLGNTGLLVSNEISKKRSRILVENIERFGARNALVTNESADRLAKVFPQYFDLIVLDAPCSGEGMFRKDPEAMSYWSKEYPKQCASLQREILEQALMMLRPGGELIYSTCTWAPEENEDVIRWLLATYDDLELIDVPKVNGMSAGIDMPEVARMYPHRFKGEGQFVAKLRKTEVTESPITPTRKKKSKQVKAKLPKDKQKLWEGFAKKHLRVALAGDLETFGDELYLKPSGLPDTAKLKIARNGLHLGTFKKNRFEPSYALGLALKPSEVLATISLNDEDYKQYLSGQVVPVAKDYPNGWYQVLASGNGFGFAKVSQGQLKNYMPKGLRVPYHLLEES